MQIDFLKKYFYMNTKARTDFSLLTKGIGWIIFGISTLVYYLTVEPTVSFWDSGEFIASAYTLGIPHPPGAPLFILIARLFSLFSFGDTSQIAFMINMVSVICSGFTIFFLYHILILIGKKMINGDHPDKGISRKMVLISSAAIGSFIFAFTDSFWFSASETEVYSMSSLFTAIVIWAMLKWQNIETASEENKWLIFIAYLMGLSFGVHLLNLLAIPCLALLYYFKKIKTHSTRNLAFTFLISGIILFTLLYGLVVSANIAKNLEVFLVNSLGLPFGSGVIFFGLLLASSLIYGVYYTNKNHLVTLNTIFLSAVFVFIGYSSYTTIVIRSAYNPPVNQNNPANLMNFIFYLNMDQYPTRPLLYGPYYTAELIDQKNGKPFYVKGKNRYEVAYHKIENTYNPAQSTIFPRTYSTFQPQHPQEYEQILGLQKGQTPSFRDNLYFLFKHQIGHMYLRYLMWNFAGREGSINGAGWLSPVDAFKSVPALIKNDKARNNYFMLPLLLGIFGMWYTYRKNRESFWLIATLFIMTGVALVVYLNGPPSEPRERDYIYTGSFFAFAIWIGLGIIALNDWLRKISRNEILTSAAVTLCCVAIPVLMLWQNWDDHDRSKRYFSVDASRNLLSSCAPNAILFTGGDNDTYPLWYLQEVEGFRTDVRVVVLSYFNTDWYIDQKKRSIRESEALPISLERSNYKQGGLNDVLPVIANPKIKEPIDVSQFLELIKKEHFALQISTSLGKLNSLPSKSLSLNIHSSDLKNAAFIPEDKKQFVADKMIFKVKESRLEKKDLVILDLLDTNRWERPIYFNNTSLSGVNIDLNGYVVQEGDTFRLLPTKNPSDEMIVNTDVMFENMMNKSQFRQLDNPDIYYNGNYEMHAAFARSNFNVLAENLIKEKDYERAREVIERSLKVIPDQGVPYDFSTVDTVKLLVELKDFDKAGEISDIMGKRADEFLTWYTDLAPERYRREASIYLFALQNFSRVYKEAGMDDKALYYQQLFLKHYNKLS